MTSDLCTCFFVNVCSVFNWENTLKSDPNQSILLTSNFLALLLTVLVFFFSFLEQSSFMLNKLFLVC